MLCDLNNIAQQVFLEDGVTVTAVQTQSLTKLSYTSIDICVVVSTGVSRVQVEHSTSVSVPIPDNGIGTGASTPVSAPHRVIKGHPPAFNRIHYSNDANPNSTHT